MRRPTWKKYLRTKGKSYAAKMTKERKEEKPPSRTGMAVRRYASASRFTSSSTVAFLDAPDDAAHADAVELQAAQAQDATDRAAEMSQAASSTVKITRCRPTEIPTEKIEYKELGHRILISSLPGRLSTRSEPAP